MSTGMMVLDLADLLLMGLAALGVGSQINAGPAWAGQGYHWFIGGSAIGHDGPASNGQTDASTTNAILLAAQTSEAAMVAAMPGWLAAWFTAQAGPLKARFHQLCAGHPGVK